MYVYLKILCIILTCLQKSEAGINVPDITSPTNM
jgi:hypothetical protein